MKRFTATLSRWIGEKNGMKLLSVRQTHRKHMRPDRLPGYLRDFLAVTENGTVSDAPYPLPELSNAERVTRRGLKTHITFSLDVPQHKERTVSQLIREGNKRSQIIANIHDLADFLGTEPTPAACERRFDKDDNVGSTVTTSLVSVGTSVSGCDASFDETLVYPFTVTELESAINNCKVRAEDWLAEYGKDDDE